MSRNCRHWQQWDGRFHERAQLNDWASALERACNRQRLRLHAWQVQPTRAGVTWLGFRILPNEVRVKRSSVARAKGRLQRQLDALRRNEIDVAQFRASLQATFAHWKYGTTYRLREDVLRGMGILHNDAEPWAL